MKPSICLVHADLDGAMCYTLLNLYKKTQIPVKSFSQADFLVQWKNNFLPKINEYEKIYIFDLSINEEPNLFDFSNVVIVDHHENSATLSEQFTKAKVYFAPSTSASMALYKILAQKNKEPFLSNKQKLLLLLVDDFDSYQHKISTSRLLNRLFWSLPGDRIQKFYNTLSTGFNGFTPEQKNIIAFYNKRLVETIKTLEIYKTDLVLEDAKYNFYSTFAEFAINDVADYVIEKYKADIVTVVNLKTQKVSFRKSKQCSINLNILAKNLADGGGHEAAAGGILNETFINFSKTLLKV